jgi:hypothetical protein
VSDKTKPVRTRSEAGGPDHFRDPEEAAAVASLGERTLGPTDIGAVAGGEAVRQQRAAYDNIADKALTFAEGVVDALTLGLVHETGEGAAIRRDVNSLSALGGNIAGTALGLVLPGPVKSVTGFGKASGERAARTIFSEQVLTSRQALAVGTAGGAGEAAALMGATALGRQVTDAILDDKAMSASAVLHEAGLGSVLGGGFSFLTGVIGRAASRYEAKAQGGMLDLASEEAQGLITKVKSARGAWDDALAVHEQRLGVMKATEQMGVLDAPGLNLLRRQELAVAEARSARSALEGLDFEQALRGDPKAWGRWVKAMERYETRMAAVDDLLTPNKANWMVPQRLGQPLKDPGPPVTEGVGFSPDPLISRMRDPNLQAQYEALYGRKYTPPGTVPADVAPTPRIRPEPGQGPLTPAGSARGRAARALDDTVAPTPEPASAVAAVADDFKWPAGWGPGTTPAAPVKMFDDMALYEGGALAKGGAADVRQNAEAFAQFRARMAGDTPMAPLAPELPTPAATPRARAEVFEPRPADLPPGATPMRWGQPLDTPAIPQAPVPSGGSTKPTPAMRTGSTLDEDLAEMIARKPPAKDAAAHRAVRKYINDWYAEAEAMGPRVSPGDKAAQEIRATVEAIQGNGRTVAAGNTEIAKLLRLPEPKTTLGATLNDLYVMRHLADAAVDAGKGVVQSGKRPNRLVNWMLRREAGRAGASLGAGVIGAKLGGPLGFFAGAAAVQYLGFAGKAAGLAGRMYQRSLKAANALLTPRRATMGALAVANLASNRPVAYSERGPIKDPVERIEDLLRVAASPQGLAETVARAGGDLTIVAPEFMEAAVALALGQVQYLASVAPPIRYDGLGRRIPPPAGAVRRFLEAENAVFNLDGVLTAIGRGQVTRAQVEALRGAHPPVYQALAIQLMDPERLSKLDRTRLKAVEMVLGAPLTASADPMFTVRQQSSWAQPAPGGPGSPGPGGPTQALKIPGQGGPPSDRVQASAALPSQSFGISGRAPGN